MRHLRIRLKQRAMVGVKVESVAEANAASAAAFDEAIKGVKVVPACEGVKIVSSGTDEDSAEDKLPDVPKVEHWRFGCGGRSCKLARFTVIRDEPKRGPFEWQELIVTMCEHGELAPLLNKLEQKCKGHAKMYPHLQWVTLIWTGCAFTLGSSRQPTTWLCS